MKRFLALSLAALTLCGCQIQIPQETIPPTEPTVAETQAPTEPPVIIRQPLETYDLPYKDLVAAAPMGSDILLFQDTPAMLVKLSGDTLTQSAKRKLNTQPDPDSILQVSEAGVCYIAGTDLVFLDESLRETTRLSLPKEMNGTPFVSEDLSAIYYAVGGAIRSIRTKNGHDRPLRETTYTSLNITALHTDDALLECLATDAQGKTCTIFLDTATGELRRRYENTISLSIGSESWFATVSEDGYNQFLVGTDSDNIQALTPDYAAVALRPMPELNALLFTTTEETAIRLELFGTAGGNLLSAMTIPGATVLHSIWSDPVENCIWLLGDENQLYRWDLEKSPAEADISCVGPYYTRENPDTAGIEALNETFAELEQRYAIDIHIGEDALDVNADGYTLVSEYRVPVLEKGVESLAQALALFDPDFFQQAAQVSNDSLIHISLVQSMSGSTEADTPCGVTGTQFWDADGKARIILTLGDTLKQDLCHTLGHIIDARILSRSSALDWWEELNPPEFEYDYSYNLNLSREDNAYADAFIDTFAMSFPTEDRARIFEYAMTEGNAARFQSEALQQKLTALCTGIRKAFQLTGDAPLTWEQYVINP